MEPDPDPIDALIRELDRPCKRRQPDSRKSPPLPKKIRHEVPGEMAADDQSIDKTRLRTPSPSENQRQLPNDAYLADDIADATPRLDPFARSAYPVPNLSYEEALSNEPIKDDDDLQARTTTRSRTPSQSSTRSASPKKTTSLRNVGNGVIYTHLANTTASKREQLGGGLALLEKLEDVSNKPVVSERLRSRLEGTGTGEVKKHQFDTSDQRPLNEVLCELRTIQDIISLSLRCSRNCDSETEWNHRVRTKVLDLALGSDETSVGFRSVTAARITPGYRPTHSNNLTTGKIVDYAIHLEPSDPARHIISDLIKVYSLIGVSTGSINHVDYEVLRARPIAVSIVTRTKSRTVEEGKVQLGVWVAAQVARLEALVELIDPRAEQPYILSQTVFPLIDIQSDAWSLFFARVMPSNASRPSNSDTRKPVSNIQIFHSVPLGSTANTVQVYRLVKRLKVLRDWVDEDFRRWWDGFLGVGDAEAGDE